MTMPLPPEASVTNDASAQFDGIWEEHRCELLHAVTPDARDDIEQKTHDRVKSEFLAFWQNRRLPSNHIQLDINE
jgi:hypothetical protein